MELFITKKNKKIRLETVFTLCFLLYAFFSFNSFLYGKRCISIVLYMTILLGITVLIKKLFFSKISLGNNPGLILLFAFILSGLFSTVLIGDESNLKENLIKIIFQIFFFFILYTSDIYSTSSYRKTEFKWISIFINLYMLLGGTVSLLLMWSGYSSMNKMEGGWSIGIGFVWGRLWGIYTEPNYMTIMSVIIILFNYCIIRKGCSLCMRIICIINIIVQFLFICFSDSRTGAVAFGVSIAIFMFNSKIYNVIHRKKLKKNLAPIFLLAIVVCLLSFALPRITIKAYNACINYYSAQVIKTQEIPATQSKTSNDSSKATALTIDRGYDLSEDISNRRFSIWKSGLEIFMTTPILGTSFSGILSYTEEKGLDTYIVNNGAEKFSTIHNEVLNILVSQGVVGILIFAALVFTIFINFSGFYHTSSEEFLIRNFLFTSLVSIICGAMFLTGMFYSNSPTAILFWYFLGYLMFLIKKQ